MDWKEKMRNGMEMIRDACEGNTDWDNCPKCPFKNLCNAIVNSKYNTENVMEWDMAVIIGNELENENAAVLP